MLPPESLLFDPHTIRQMETDFQLHMQGAVVFRANALVGPLSSYITAVCCMESSVFHGILPSSGHLPFVLWKSSQKSLHHTSALDTGRVTAAARERGAWPGSCRCLTHTTKAAPLQVLVQAVQGSEARWCRGGGHGSHHGPGLQSHVSFALRQRGSSAALELRGDLGVKPLCQYMHSRNKTPSSFWHTFTVIAISLYNRVHFFFLFRYPHS